MDLSCVEKRMHDLLDLGVPGCSISIRQDHKEIYRYVCGVRDRETKVPMTGEEFFYIFSCSKPITVTAIMQLLEKGVFSLNTPIADLIPQWHNAMVLENGKLVKPNQPITIHHLLTMSAGIKYSISEDLTVDRSTVTTYGVAAEIAKKPLLFHPGDQFRYSLCHDVLAAGLEVATGKRFGQYLKENIFDPLGMKNTGFETDVSPLPAQYQCLQETGEVVDIGLHHIFNFNDHYESGGGGMVSTLDDYALFADAMACGGVGANGARIISPESIRAMQENQLGKFVRSWPEYHCYAGPGYGYGLGVRTLIDKSQGQRSPLGEFGWDGANGAFVIIDPVNKLSFSFMQHMRNWPRLMGEFYAPIRDEVYEALGL